MPFLVPLIPVITAATAVAGVGLSAYGAIGQAKAAKAQSQSNQQQAQYQQQQEALRQQAMELDNQRRQREELRQIQRVRAASTATANADNGGGGAFSSSGLFGAYGQTSGQGTSNLLGLSQSLALGRANFGLNQDITQTRYNYASAGGDYATAQGFSSLGNGLVNSLGTIDKLSQGFGSPKSSSFPSTWGWEGDPFGGK